MITAAASGPGVLHMITFTWHEHATEAQVSEFHRRIVDFAATSEGVVFFEAGSNAGFMEENADYGIVARFVSRGAFDAYRTHPTHLQIIDETLVSIMASRSRLQFLT